jgi:parallel beta helix pectate lyase-like protein
MNQNRRKLLAISVFVVLVACFEAVADEGRIPIAAPHTTLTLPGRYVVTHNLSGSGSPIITIAASANVDLDLNGMEISQNDSGQVAIDVVGGGTDARIHDGSVRGGQFGISVGGIGKRVVIERLHVSGSGIDGVRITEVEEFVVRNNMFHDILDPLNGTGVRVVISGGISKQGLIEGNAIRNVARGIVVLDGRAVVVTNNRMIAIDGTAIEIANGKGLQILSNSITSAILGISLDGNSFDNVIRENAITGCTALGIDILGDRNLLDANLTNGNASWGIRLSPGAINNVYRGNVARGNAGSSACPIVSNPDFCVHTVGNTSAGNNFLPSAGM